MAGLFVAIFQLLAMLPASRKSYAFVEFEDARDAEDAYYEMQHRKVDGYLLSIQWAKNAPGRNWRYDDRRDDRRSRSPQGRRRSPGGRRSSRSPRRSSRSRSPRAGDRRRSGSRDRRDEKRDIKRDEDVDIKAENGARSPVHENGHKEDNGGHRERSGSPQNAGHGRSPSPQGRERSRSRSRE
ncbi:hypothetical protein HDV00_005933 [Rhizophlyctis rosea]|nr:hypothetical protein HDV00_005933 [Rhizophlyctis rosea]